jgi:hypothetical protein
MDSSICASIYHRYKTGDLRTGHFTKDYKTIFRWVLRYFKKHGKAPKQSIQNIFDNRKRSLGKEQRELTEAYLARLAEDYIDEQESPLDPDYIRTEVLPDFMREREIAYRIEKAQQNIELGQYEEAEEIVKSYNPILIEEEDENLGVIMPLTRNDLKNTSDDAFSEEDVVYRFEHNQEALQSILGNLRRGWLVAVTGIEKAGKSYLMEEIGYVAAMEQDRKVLKINLELSETLQRERLWKRISGATDAWQTGDNIYPVIDCENNQYGTCRWAENKKPDPRKKHRQSRIYEKQVKKPLFENPAQVFLYETNAKRKWEPCDICRTLPSRSNQRETKSFIPTIYFDHSKLKEVNKKVVRRAMRRYSKWAKLENYRVKCFPRFSVTFDEVRSYIMRYIDKTQWEPDIVMLDYLDIFASENSDVRIDIDNRWKKASKLAGELNCLVLNADQANKAARTAYAIDKTSTSESKTKDGHLDVRLAINQTPHEKDLNIARINTLFHRHFNFNERREVMVTQRLEVSQPILDSARVYEREKKYKISTKKYL